MIEKTALGDFWRGYMAGSKLQLYKYEPSKKKNIYKLHILNTFTYLDAVKNFHIKYKSTVCIHVMQKSF